jgi:hypothetical protein
MLFLMDAYSVLCEMKTCRSVSFQTDEIIFIDLCIVCIVHVLDFIIFFQQMYNIFVDIYLLLITLQHIPIFTHHPQEISCLC